MVAAGRVYGEIAVVQNNNRSLVVNAQKKLPVKGEPKKGCWGK